MAPAIPKGPVLGWNSLARTAAPPVPSVAGLPHLALTSSGRAAIYQALLQLDLADGEAVLVPSYHCPTMVAPIVLAGLRPVFFDIREDGLPDLQSIPPDVQARAMIVTQYFGLAQSLHEVRQWCDAQGVTLIEDCAHCYFGHAGSRPAGAWGDYCTASLTKFYPVPEGGLLASAHHPLRPMALERQDARAQVKGLVDVLELASQYGRLPGLNGLLGGVFHLKGGHASPQAPAAGPAAEAAPVASPMEICDMGRIARKALWITDKMWRGLPDGRIIARRRAHYERYARLLAGLPDQQPLARLPRDAAAPYVYPVWVEDADRVYHGLRARGVPVFRWDRVWPGAPHEQHATSRRWSRHLLQFLCHQDLRDQDIQYGVDCLESLLAAPAGLPSSEKELLA